MTLSNELNRIDATSVGGATYPYTFKIFADSDLTVIVTDTAGVATTKVLTADYSVTGAGTDAGGTVVFVVAPTTGYRVSIIASVPLTQTTDLVNETGFFQDRIETALDRTVRMAQVAKEIADRGLRLPEGEADDPGSDLLTVLPSFADRKGRNLSFDPDTAQPVATAPASAVVSAAMANVVIKPTLAEAREAMGPWGDALVTSTVSVGSDDETARTLADRSSDVVNVKDFGAVGNGIADDADKIQAAIDAAYAARSSFKPSGSGAVYTDNTPTVILPAGRYKITSALSAPSALRLVGAGTASIEPAGAYPAINSLTAYQLHVEGINFIGGTTAVVIQNDNTESALVNFIDCEFKKSSDWAVTATPITPGGGINVNHLSTILTFKGCKFHNVARGVKTWCDYTRLEDCWATWGDDLCTSDTAFFEVRNGPTPLTGNLEGGTLILDNFVGVPNMALGKTAVRWIDNYWRVLCRRSRFGQEASGGVPIVYNYAPGANSTPYSGGCVVLRDCEVWAGPSRADGGVILLQTEVPGLVVLDGNFGPINCPLVKNLGISNMATYLAGFATPERSFRLFFGPMSPGTQPDPSPLGALVQAELLPYATGEVWQVAANVNPGTNCQTQAAPNVAKSYCSRQVNSSERTVTLTGILGPTGSNVITAGSAIGALGDAAHYPSRNLIFPIVGVSGVYAYLQVLSNGSILTGATLTGSTQTLQMDGISYRINN